MDISNAQFNQTQDISGKIMLLLKF